MARCRHHSGYLADDEAAHSTYVVRLPKKHLLPEMRPTYKLGRVPHLPSMDQGHQQNLRHPRAFGGFLDFLTEGQVLDSLQTVVERATERVATMKTEAGVPLVDIQDPVEMPNSRHRSRARPSVSTMRRHRAQPTLFAGHPNNYPSCSSSMSDSHSSTTAGWLGSHSQDSDLGARGIGSLPPMRDKLLLEKNLKRLLRLENKGKVLNQPCSQRDSLLWDSLSSRTSSQWTQEQPLSWFSGLWGSSDSVTPETSEPGLGEQEMIFVKQGLNKEMKSLLNQPTSFNLPTYCPLKEPHHTLDFLAEHRLFPALQRVVSQAVDKLSHACRHNGFPLFPVASDPSPVLPGNSDLQPSSKASIPTDREAGGEPCDSLTTATSPKSSLRKSKGRRGSSSNAVQMATRFRLKSPNTKFSKKKPLPSISSVSSLSYISNPWFEELTNFLVEQAVSLLICKYKFEKSLNKQLGFISFPITEVLMDIFLGFKKVKGTHIRLSSDINWTCLLRKLEEAELARQALRHASRSRTSPQSASRVGTSQHSTEPSSTQPELTGGTNQNQSPESGLSLHPELPIRQLLSPRDPGTGQEQTPNRNLSEVRPSVITSASTGSRSSKSKEVANFEDEDSEEEEDNDEDETKDFSECEHTPPSLPLHESVDFMNEPTVKSPNDSP